MDKALYKQSESFLSRCSQLLILVLTLLFSGCGKEEQEIRILFTGDILLSRNVRAEIESKNADPWANLKELFSSADHVIGNLEGAVGEYEGQESAEARSLIFDVKAAHLPLLSAAGFSLITCENNHSADLGEEGWLSTLSVLRDNNLKAVHYNNSPYFFQAGNYTVGIIVLNMINGRDGKCQTIPSIEVKQKLRLAKSLSNLVVVSIHWGNELLEWPGDSQRNTAKWLVNNGADLIIGSHPHVIQEMEMIEGKPVFFSLGNHLFDQKYLSTKKGLIADCRIKNGKLTCRGIVTHTKKDSFFPEIISEEIYQTEPVPLRENFSAVGLRVIPVSQTNPDGKTVLGIFKDGRKLWETHPMPLVSISKARFEGDQEYLFTLENYYSSLDKEISLRPYVYSIDERGLTAKWRGSALAWPMLDAVLCSGKDPVLCALHRGDSFIAMNKDNQNTRIAAYKWNGFGFSGVEEEAECAICEGILKNN